MDIFFIVITLLAGLGALLIGFKMINDNMERFAGSGLKKLFHKTSGKQIVGVAMGAITTGVVQSSGITTVMVVGFVNAGIMTLTQAAAVIMGANIGTTITAQIVALQAFDIQTLFMVLLFVGAIMSQFFKNDKVKSLGLALAGLGLVFLSLNLFSSTFSKIREYQVITDMLTNTTNPFLLLVIGILLTAIMQSSSAVTSIVITMAASGLIIGGGGNAVLYLILGSNIGSCITALMSSVGAGTNAKRASMIHLLFNLFGAILCMIPLLIFPRFMEVTFSSWFTKPETQIAMFHTAFNVLCTLIFLPVSKLLVKLSCLIIKEKGKKQEKTFMDPRLMATPSIAIEQLYKETFRMADMVIDNLKIALGEFENKNTDITKQVQQKNKDILSLSEEISQYLITLSSHEITLDVSKKINALHSNVSDLLRISDISDNMIKYTLVSVEKNLIFSEQVKSSLDDLYQKILNQYRYTKEILLYGHSEMLEESDQLEDEIDKKKKEMMNDHIARMSRGECKAENNSVFINLISNLERTGDHLSYMAHSLDNI